MLLMFCRGCEVKSWSFEKSIYILFVRTSYTVHHIHCSCQHLRGDQPVLAKGTPSAKSQSQSGRKDDLNNFKLLDPLKYARLAARLVTPGQQGGPCPPPTFLGQLITLIMPWYKAMKFNISLSHWNPLKPHHLF